MKCMLQTEGVDEIDNVDLLRDQLFQRIEIVAADGLLRLAENALQIAGAQCDLQRGIIGLLHARRPACFYHIGIGRLRRGRDDLLARFRTRQRLL